MHPPILGVGGGAHLRFCDMEIQHQDGKREWKRHSLPNVYADTLFGVANKTQRSNPGQAHNRRQDTSYGKAGPTPEGFSSPRLLPQTWPRRVAMEAWLRRDLSRAGLASPLDYRHKGCL